MNQIILVDLTSNKTLEFHRTKDVKNLLPKFITSTIRVSGIRCVDPNTWEDLREYVDLLHNQINLH